MSKLVPFQNESDSLTIDDLTIENRLDRVSIYGSLQITRDKQGLKHAQALKAMLDSVVTLLKGADLPDHIPAAAAEKTDNPFK